MGNCALGQVDLDSNGELELLFVKEQGDLQLNWTSVELFGSSSATLEHNLGVFGQVGPQTLVASWLKPDRPARTLVYRDNFGQSYIRLKDTVPDIALGTTTSQTTVSVGRDLNSNGTADAALIVERGDKLSWRLIFDPVTSEPIFRRIIFGTVGKIPFFFRTRGGEDSLAVLSRNRITYRSVNSRIERTIRLAKFFGSTNITTPPKTVRGSDGRDTLVFDGGSGIVRGISSGKRFEHTFQHPGILLVVTLSSGEESFGMYIPVPLQKVRKKQGTGISLRSKAPGGTNKYPFQQKEPSDIFNWNGYSSERGVLELYGGTTFTISAKGSPVGSQLLKTYERREHSGSPLPLPTNGFGVTVEPYFTVIGGNANPVDTPSQTASPLLTAAGTVPLTGTVQATQTAPGTTPTTNIVSPTAIGSTPTAHITAPPTYTPYPTNTPAPTYTPYPTFTSTVTATNTFTATITGTPTATPTSTSTPTVTSTFTVPPTYTQFPTHTPMPTYTPYPPPTLGSGFLISNRASDSYYSVGVAWGDYDNDGDPDRYTPHYCCGGFQPFYRNNGNGTFAAVGAAAGVADTGNGQGAAWGDYDGDGDLDLYLVNNGTNRLYRNNGNGIPILAEKVM